MSSTEFSSTASPASSGARAFELASSIIREAEELAKADEAIFRLVLQRLQGIETKRRELIHTAIDFLSDVHENARQSSLAASEKRGTIAERVFSFLEASGNAWMTKEQILAHTGVDATNLRDLIHKTRRNYFDVDKDGPGRAARYRLKPLSLIRKEPNA